MNISIKDVNRDINFNIILKEQLFWVSFLSKRQAKESKKKMNEWSNHKNDTANELILKPSW